jgi:cytochrome c peroxidase
MNTNNRSLALALSLTLLSAPVVCAQSSDADILKLAQMVFKPVPTVPPEIKDNLVTPEKTELGKMLFFEPRLSKSGTISCNSCHNLSMGGDDNLPTSVGHGWQKGPRNSPTVLNAVFNVAQFWDGRAEDLKAQADPSWSRDGESPAGRGGNAEEHARLRRALPRGVPR